MKILRLPEVKEMTGHRADESIYSRIRSGEFTNGVAIGERAKGWPEHEVQAIVAATIAGHTTDQIKALVRQLHADRSKLLAPPSVQVEKTTTPPTPLPTITTRHKSLAAA